MGKRGTDHGKPRMLGYGIFKNQGILKREITNEKDTLEKSNVSPIQNCSDTRSGFIVKGRQG